MTSAFMEQLNRYRATEHDYNVIDYQNPGLDAAKAAFEAAMREVQESSFLPETLAEAIEAVKQIGFENGIKSSSYDAESLETKFLCAALSYFEKLESDPQVKKVNRLALEPTEAMDDDAKALADLVEKHRGALATWDAEVDDIYERNHPVNVELDETRRAILDFRPTSLEGVHQKAAAMLTLRPLCDWDDIDREELIRAFTDGEVARS